MIPFNVVNSGFHMIINGWWMITFSEGIDGGNWLKYANEVGSKIVIEGMVIELLEYNV